MPRHREHYKFARDFGIDIDKKTAREIDRFLDFPKHPLTGKRLPHKALHNWIGIHLIRKRWGEKGRLYALSHLLLDRLNEKYFKRGLIPVVEEAPEPRPKSLVEIFFEKVCQFKLLEMIFKLMK
ncbi:MAG: hypothetical protein ACTSYM_03945 [Candidatus Baldrarchaeia archaeon]